MIIYIQLHNKTLHFQLWTMLLGIVAFVLFACWLSFATDNQKMAEASGKNSVLQVGPNEEIKFDYTDDNQGENLVIKTDKKIYYGISSAEVNFSVTNIGKKNEKVGLQAYFPQHNGQVKKMEQWKKDISYKVDVVDFGPMDYGCQDKWQKKTETPDPQDEMVFTYYICPATKEKKACNELSENGKTCHIENEETGTHKETKLKDDWEEISIQNNELPKRQALVDKVLFKSPPIKEISQYFKVKKSTKGEGIKIKPGETEYFKMEIDFSPYSSDEFYIEAIGENGSYGLLDPWFDSGWQYRKSLAINGTTAGAQTDYEMEVIVHYGSGTDSGKDVYCSSNCNSDFSDVRFSASDETTELDYWLKSYTASSVATFWVEVGSIPASPSSTSIYLYYGNSGASTTSNGENTFDFFDDFSGDLSKWTIDAANTDAVSISSGALRHNPDSSQSRNSYSDTRVRTTSYKITNGIIEYDLYLAGTSSSAPRIIHQFGWRVQSLDFQNGYCWRLQNSATDGGHLEFSGSWSPFGTAYNATSGNTWHSVKETVNGSSYTGYVDGGSGYSGSDSTKTTADYLISHVHGVSLGASSYVLVDNVRVRNYANPEPTYGTWGSEEGQPVAVSIVLDSDGTVSYGKVALNNEKDTTSSGLNDTQTARNDGSVTEDFNIKTSNAIGGTAWTVGSTAGSNVYVHSFSINGGSSWEILDTVDSYETLATGISASGTQDFDLKIGTPTSTADYAQKSITVTIQAVEN